PELGLHVDVVDDLRREDPAVPEDVLVFCHLEHQLSLGGLEVVVVVQLLAADELLQLRRLAEAVDAELALDELRVGVRPLAGDAVDPEGGDLAGDVDRAVVHRVAEAVADVAAEDHAAALHHEAGHHARVAEDDDRAALLVDSGARADVPVHDDDAGHHVLAGRPADAAVDRDLRAVDEAAAEVAEAALERDAAAREDADAERVLRARVQDRDVGEALFVEEAPQLQVDLPRRQVVGVERRAPVLDLRDARCVGVRLGEPARVVRDAALTGYRCHTSTSPSNGSYVSISRSSTARIAISSDASATMSSPS